MKVLTKALAAAAVFGLLGVHVANADNGRSSLSQSGFSQATFQTVGHRSVRSSRGFRSQSRFNNRSNFRRNRSFARRSNGFSGYSGTYRQRLNRSNSFATRSNFRVGSRYALGSNTLFVNNFGAFGLATPSRDFRWIRHGRDAFLVSTRSGVISAIVPNRFAY